MQILYLLCIIGILAPVLSSTLDDPDCPDENSIDSSIGDYLREIPDTLSELLESQVDSSSSEYSNNLDPLYGLLEIERSQAVVESVQGNSLQDKRTENEHQLSTLSELLGPQVDVLYAEYPYNLDPLYGLLEIEGSQAVVESVQGNSLQDKRTENEHQLSTLSELLGPQVDVLYAEYPYNLNPLYGLLEIEGSKAIIESVEGHSLQEQKTENEHQLATLLELLGSQVNAKSIQEESLEKKDINDRHIKHGDNRFEKRKEENLQVDKTSKSEWNKLQNAETFDDSLNESQVNSLSQLSGSYVNTMLTEEHSIQRKTSVINIQIIEEEFELTNRKNESSQEYKSSKTEENNIQKVKFFEDTNNKRHLSPILELLRPQNSTESVQEGTIQRNFKQANAEGYELRKSNNKKKQINQNTKSAEYKLQNAEMSENSVNDPQLNLLSELSESKVHIVSTQEHPIPKTEDISIINNGKYEFTKKKEEITEVRKASQSEVGKLQSI